MEIYLEQQGGLYTGDGTSQASLNRPFWVQITDYDGTRYYAWTEVTPVPGGTFETTTGGRSGGFTTSPVFDANGAVIPTDAYVLVRRAYFDPSTTPGQNLDWVYVVTYAGSALLTFVSNVCVQWATRVITVEYSTVDVSSGIVLNRTCVENPDGCCVESGSGGAESVCCPGVALPTTVCASFSGGTGALVVLDGTTLQMTWNGVNGWEGELQLCPEPTNGIVSWSFNLICQSNGTWMLIQVLNPSPGVFATGQPYGTATATSCDPFEITFTGATVSDDGAIVCDQDDRGGSTNVHVVSGPCGGGGGISRTDLGHAVASGTTATLTAVTVEAGKMLVVSCGSSAGGISGVTFDGNAMTQVPASSGGGAATIWYLHVLADTTGNVVGTASSSGKTWVAGVEVSGLSYNTLDGDAYDEGVSSPPDVVGDATGSAATYVQATFWMVNGTGVYLWSNGFTGGGQDDNIADGGDTIYFTEGYQIRATIGTPEAIVAGTTPDEWHGCVASFK